MIKYLGSKRRLVPVLEELFRRSGATTALDAFTGTTRVAQALKRHGAQVTAVDTARYAKVFADCWIATDAGTVDRRALADEIARLDALPGEAGYVTDTFCRASRFFQPANGERIDAIRAAIERDHPEGPLRPILLTSLLLAADRVDSTAGVQMAYVKQWSARSYRPLHLRVPDLLDGAGSALRGDVTALARTLPPVGLAYLDPPYNQHRYESNYHVWETLVAWDAPEHYGVACKRTDLRDADGRSPFNGRRTMPGALRQLIGDLDAEVVVVSYNDESWISRDELVDMCAQRGHVRFLAFDSRRYVGATIGVHSPTGQRVGEPGRLRNEEWIVVAGPQPVVERMTAAPLAVPR